MDIYKYQCNENCVDNQVNENDTCGFAGCDNVQVVADSTDIGGNIDFSPRFGSFTVNLNAGHANQGRVNGLSAPTLTFHSPIMIGDLPWPTPFAGFLGWSTSRTGHVLSPQMMHNGGNLNLYARWGIQDGQIVDSRVVRQIDSIGNNLSSNRQSNAINHITVHHSVSPENPVISTVNSWWTGRGWTVPGYHFLIRGDGQIWQLAPIHRSLGGTSVAAINSRTIHIALAGTFTPQALPTQAARNSFGHLCRLLLANEQLVALHNANSHIQGHDEIQLGWNCPGFTRAQFLSWI